MNNVMLNQHRFKAWSAWGGYGAGGLAEVELYLLGRVRVFGSSGRSFWKERGERPEEASPCLWENDWNNGAGAEGRCSLGMFRTICPVTKPVTQTSFLLTSPTCSFSPPARNCHVKQPHYCLRCSVQKVCPWKRRLQELCDVPIIRLWWKAGPAA